MQHSDIGTIIDGGAEVARAAPKPMEVLTDLLTSPDWRDATFARNTVRFPAVITYLWQLLAHDISRFSRADTRFEMGEGGMTAGIVNQRTSPLLLHTIYGEGLLLDDELYHPAPELPLFRLIDMSGGFAPKDLPIFSWPIHSITPARMLSPVLGDGRNADTPMMLWVAVEFMRYHNALVTKYNQLHPELNRAQLFQWARGTAILAWHQFIEETILPCVTGGTIQREALAGVKDIPDADFFHGLLRAFHVLPLDDYQLTRGAGPVSLASLLARTATHPTLPILFKRGRQFHKALTSWNSRWEMDLELLSEQGGPNETCFVPSFAAEFGSTHIVERDLASAKALGVSDITAYPNLEKHADALLKELAERYDKTLPKAQDVPLSLGFLAEAWAENKTTGGLGQTASEILWARITHWIDTARAGFDQSFGAGTVKIWDKMVKDGPDRPLPYTKTLNRT